MSNTNTTSTLKKLFSLKDDTYEDAQKRFIRSLIGLGVSIISFIACLIAIEYNVHGIGEVILSSIWFLGLPAMCISVSSPLGSIKAVMIMLKGIKNHGESAFLAFLCYPLIFIMVVFFSAFIVGLYSILCPPITALIGVIYSFNHMRRLGKIEITEIITTEI